MYKWSPDDINCIWIDAEHGFGTPGEKIMVEQQRQLMQQNIPIVIVEESGYKPKIERRATAIPLALDGGLR